MADAAQVRDDPPRWMLLAFEVCARALGALKGRRYLIADAASLVTYALQPPAKRRLCARLHSRAAGGLPAAEARRRARASYRSYARVIVDTIWIHGIPLARMFEHGEVDGVEHLDDARDSRTGGILVLAHFGSWDIAASLSCAAGHSVATVMAPVGPPSITALLAWSREIKQLELFAPAAAARGLVRALRRGGLVALLVDIPEGGPTTVVRYCNGPVRFSTGPASLARLTEAPIIPVSCWRVGERYIVNIQPPFQPGRDDDDQAVMQRIAEILERDVQRLPEQWYPFNPVYIDEP